MSASLISVLALLVTLGVLVSFHEFGHFWVARRLGVKVLRFSVGFGKPLWLRRGRVDDTEFAVAAIPLGGYVRMLDEREGEVAVAEQHRAFNRQSVWTRIAIVIAGPLFNFIFAIFAFAVTFVIGVNSLRPLLSEPVPASIAANGGFQNGDLILAIDNVEVSTLDNALLTLVDRSMAGEVIEVLVEDERQQQVVRRLDVRGQGDLTEDGRLLSNLGLVPWQPRYPAVIGEVISGSAAERDGLQAGDEIVASDGEPVSDWQQWAELIRQHPEQAMMLTVERDGQRQEMRVTPGIITTAGGVTIGRVGAAPKELDDFASEVRILVHYGLFEAIYKGAVKTWDMSLFTLRMLGRMLVGQASLENISGPITIAQFAGQTATIGIVAFLSFMALVSISLGVLNLLPIPLLDGGHLLYYLIEIIKGSEVSEAVQYVGQRIGIVVIVMLMGLALFNDMVRLIGF